MTKFILRLAALLDGERLKALALSAKGLAVLPVLLGLTATLGYAPYRLWPVTLGALTALFVLLSALSGFRAVFCVLILFFASLNLITLNWLSFVMEGFGEMPAWAVWPIIALFAVYLGLPYALAGALGLKICGSHKGAALCAALPLAVIAADFAAGRLFNGFPWMYLGNTCVEGPFAGFAPWVGVRGMDALIALCAGALAMSARRRFLYLPAVGLILLAGSFAAAPVFVTPQPPVRAALVQGNIPQALRVTPERLELIVGTYWRLSRDLFDGHELIVWPESALPVTLESEPGLLSDLNMLAHRKGSALVTGILSRDGRGRHYNSILVAGAQERLPPASAYNKRRLVPFGEFVPFERLLRPLGKIFNIPMSSFSEGAAEQEPLTVRGLSFIPAICYEAIYPEIIASLNRPDTSGILMISNDSWFGPTRAPAQHLDMARLRSMELQKPMLRGTNSGYTAHIGCRGEILGILPFGEEGVLSVSYVPCRGLTPYARLGDWATALIALALLCLGLALSRHRENAAAAGVKRLVRP